MLTSICVCTYERTDHLAKVFQSIAATCQKPYEVVVVDDASKNTEVHALLKHFQDLFTKEGIRFHIHINEKNLKHAASQNLAWDLAQGEVLMHVEDDILCPYDGWNQKMAKFLKDHPEVGQVLPEGSGRGEWIPIGPYNEYMWGLGGLFAVRKEVYPATGGWDSNLWHQVEPDFNLRVRMAGWRVAEIPGVRMVHLGEGEQHETFRRQAQIIIGVHQFLFKWNTRFRGFWDYDSLWSMSMDDLIPNMDFRRRLAAWYVAEARKLEDRYRGLGDLKDDPKYSGAVPEEIRKAHGELLKCQINAESRPWKFPNHWGAFELVNVIRSKGREREAELVTLVKNNHVFGNVRRVEHQLRELAKRMSYDLKDEELKELASRVPIRYQWKGEPVYES